MKFHIWSFTSCYSPERISLASLPATCHLFSVESGEYGGCNLERRDHSWEFWWSWSPKQVLRTPVSDVRPSVRSLLFLHRWCWASQPPALSKGWFVCFFLFSNNYSGFPSVAWDTRFWGLCLLRVCFYGANREDETGCILLGRGGCFTARQHQERSFLGFFSNFFQEEKGANLHLHTSPCGFQLPCSPTLRL